MSTRYRVPDLPVSQIASISGTVKTLDRDYRIVASVDAIRIVACLNALVEDYEATDAYPTSDEHPLYAAREVLEDLCIRDGEGDEDAG